MSKKYFIANTEKIAQFLAEKGKEIGEKEYRKLWYLLSHEEVTERFVRSNRMYKYDFWLPIGYVKIGKHKVNFDAYEELKKIESEVERDGKARI